MTGRRRNRSRPEALAARSEPDEPRQVAHIPVLVDAVLATLVPCDDAVYVDATFGSGGYSMALLGAAHCRVFGIDRDPDAVRRGRELAKQLGGRLTIIEGRFGEMVRLLAPVAVGPIAGITFDLGVSSTQLDTPERGFSFRFDGPLDMRMSGAGQSAADLVANLSESDLAEIVRAAIPRSEPGQDPATRTFQALRIAVNDELGELDRGLAAAEQLLMPGGRLAAVSFHSLEDRRVKQFLQWRSEGAPRASRHAPCPVRTPAPSFKLLGRRAIRPDAAEIARNPRARSARLRAAERSAAPAWPAAFASPDRGRRGQGA